MQKMDAASAPLVRDVKIEQGLFGNLYKIMKESVLPYQWQVLNDETEVQPDFSIENFTVGNGEEEEAYPSHCITNFRIAAKLQEGSFYGMVFQDSDLAKWIEAVSYLIMGDPRSGWEEQADEVIDIIGKAQQEDGYLNTYYTLQEPGKRWTNLCECHELYCAGHMMEAAVAYYRATGKRRLLDIMTKMAKHIYDTLGPEEQGKLPGYPGHEGIELALVKMYEATGEAWILELARFFLDERGKKPLYFDIEFEERNRESHFAYLNPPYGMYSYGPKYGQYHMRVKDQKEFVGHAVRCMYLASGMADVVRETGDTELLSACKALFENMRNRRMYVTGAIGSSSKGECFTSDYDLPNDLVYGETCASVGMAFFMRRMLRLEQDGKYADVMERALYNTCIAGMALDGKGFFYVNPLEVTPQVAKNNPDKKHIRTERPAWFGCACCPPNLARLVMSLGEYIYGIKDNRVYVHLYIENEAKLDVAGREVKMRVKSGYPYDMDVAVYPSAGEYALCLRIPDWSAKNWTLTVDGERMEPPVEKGYVMLDGIWMGVEEVLLKLDDTVHKVRANPNVIADIGKMAVQYGPVVYCLEEKDNGPGLQKLFIDKSTAFAKVWKGDNWAVLWRLRRRAAGWKICRETRYTATTASRHINPQH